MSVATSLDRTLSVNAIVARWPQTIPVFNQFGIDSCCGGGAPLDEAARRDGADAEALSAALRRVVEGA